MRFIVFLFGIIMLAVSACQKKIPAGFVEQRANFKSYKFYPNLKGEIKINVPVKFDTLLNWVDRSDAGGITKIRFVNSKDCLKQESGYIHKDVCDNDFDRLTIETCPIGPANVLKPDTGGFAYGNAQFERAARARGNKFIWHSNSIEIINERQFVVREYFGSHLLGFNKAGQAVKGPFERIVATTQLNQGGIAWGIALVFECKNCDYLTFAKNAHTTLHSVVIDTVVTSR